MWIGVFMEFQVEKLTRADRQILRMFDEVQDNIVSLRDMVADRGQTDSSLCWIPLIRNCEQQLHKLFITTFGAEVSFRTPHIPYNDLNFDDL